MKRTSLPSLPALALILSAISLLAGIADAAAPDLPIFRDPWKPRATAILATADSESITEQDLYLWQLLRGKDPLIVKDWESPANAVDASVALESSIKSLLETRYLARSADELTTPPLLAPEMQSRIMAAPAAAIVYADYLVREGVEVQAEDVAYFYRKNGEKYREPAKLEVRRLMIPLQSVQNEEERREAMQLAEDLRAKAIAAGGLLPLFDQYRSYAMDEPIGSTFTIRQGRGDVSDYVESEAFKLLTSQISSPLATPNGVMLIEVLSRQESRITPLPVVESEIQAALFPHHYKLQFDRKAASAVQNAFPLNRAEAINWLEPEMELLQVDWFSLTKEEFYVLHPEFARQAGRKPSKALKAAVADLIRGEVLTQELERQSLSGSSFYPRANELARDIVTTDNYLVEARIKANPSEAEIRKYLDENIAEIAPSFDRSLWKLESTPSNPASLTSGQLTVLTSTMLQQQREIVAQAQQLMNDRIEISGSSAAAYPDQVMSRLVREDESGYKVLFTRTGEYTAREARESFGIDYDKVQSGQFTAPRRTASGSVVTYYVAEQIAIPRPDDAELMARARAGLIDASIRRPAADRIREMETNGRLVFKF